MTARVFRRMGHPGNALTRQGFCRGQPACRGFALPAQLGDLDDPGIIGLWVDAEGRLLAWAVMQAPFWTIDYAFHPYAGPDLHRELLTWADDRARQLFDTPFGYSCWFVMVFANQTSRIHDIELQPWHFMSCWAFARSKMSSCIVRTMVKHLDEGWLGCSNI